VPERDAAPSPSQPSALDRLRAVRGFVFDLDGTLVLGDARNRGLAPLPGALEITRWVAARGLPQATFTNGSGKSPAEYAKTLRGIGFDLPDEAVLTPASSAVTVLARRGHRRVLALGTEGITVPLREAGFDVVAAGDPGTGADAVLVGYCPDFAMPAFEAACRAIWDGAAVYTVSRSMFFATAQGRAIGMSRAICAMLKSQTGCRVNLVGKPSLDALRCAATRLGVHPSELAVVGDDPELEVPMAHRGRAMAIAVESGLGAAGSFDHLPPQRRPHLQVRGVDELLSICREARPLVGRY
jgi:4-nitrophenyl phosphatase